MENKNLFRFYGWLEIRDNKTKELICKVDNLIVNGGLAQAALLLGDAAAEPLTEACIGTGSTAAAAGDTALETQVDVQTPVFSRIQTLTPLDTAQFVSVHTGGVGGWTLREYGIRTAADVLFNHVVFAAIILGEGNELEFTYKVQVQRVV